MVGGAALGAGALVRRDLFEVGAHRVERVAPTRRPGWARTPAGCRAPPARRAAPDRRASRRPSAAYAKPLSVRAMPISSSGLMPGSRRRNSFRIRRSPKTTDVLLCSARPTRGRELRGRGRRAASGYALVGVAVTSPRRPGEALPRANRVEQRRREAWVVQGVVERPLRRLRRRPARRERSAPGVPR